MKRTTLMVVSFTAGSTAANFAQALGSGDWQRFLIYLSFAWSPILIFYNPMWQKASDPKGADSVASGNENAVNAVNFP